MIEKGIADWLRSVLSTVGAAKVEGQAKADSLSRGSQRRQVLATGRGNGANRGKRGGRDHLVSQLERPGFSAVALPRAKAEGSGRPLAEAQTRTASGA